jgi:PAS domain S-box-containing protein
MGPEPVTVLLVEDDAGDARLVREALAAAGLALSGPTHVERVDQALDRLTTEPVDVVLLDLSLADGQGVDGVVALHRLFPTVPIVALTGVADEDLALKALQSGAQDYLPKTGLRPDTLGRAVRYAIERRRAQEALARTSEGFRSLIENALDVITVVRIDGTIVYESPSVRQVLGYRPEELTGCSVFDFLHPDDVPAVAALFRDAADNVGAVTNGEFRFRHRDGSWRIFEGIGKAVVDDGQLVAIVNSRDITRRKEAEDQLRLLRRAVEQSPSSIVITDAAGAIEYANPRFCQVSGYALEEVIGRNPRFLQSGLTTAAEYQRLWATITAGREWRGELLNRKKDGQTFWEAISISPVTDEHGTITHYVGIKEDVTSRRRADEEMRRQRELLYQSEKLAAMGQLLAGVAHELNNPLAVVLGRAALLRDRTQEPHATRQASIILQAAERCARIVRNFLALARQRPPEWQRVQPNDVIREAVELLGYPLRVDDIVVTLDLDPEMPVLLADPHQLHQAVVNLVSNAHQAMREVPAASRRLTLTSRADAGPDRMSIEVADTGPGIPPGLVGRIFEPFFTTKPPGQGTGLGLSLCQGIVESHGGTIGLVSRPGAGAVFRIELPCRSEAEAADHLGADPGMAVTGKRILVVDDEPDVAGVLAELLAADRHTVELAENGVVALEKARRQSFDAVVSDVRMPNLDGPGLYRELVRLDQGWARRFVFLTGDTFSPETRDFLEEVAAPRLDKPFTAAEIRRALGQVLGG